MKHYLLTYIGWLLLAAAIGFYFYGIYEAIRLTVLAGDGRPGPYPEVLSTTMATLQSLLLTNLGALLGISVTNPQSQAARSLFLRSRMAVGVEAIPDPKDLRTEIQLAGAILFMLGLIACLITWATKDFKTDSEKVVPLIFESGKMFIAVVVAYLAALLSARATGNPAPNPPVQ